MPCSKALLVHSGNRLSAGACAAREQQLEDKRRRMQQERSKQLALDCAVEADRVAGIRLHEVRDRGYSLAAVSRALRPVPPTSAGLLPGLVPHTVLVHRWLLL